MDLYNEFPDPTIEISQTNTISIATYTLHSYSLLMAKMLCIMHDAPSFYCMQEHQYGHLTFNGFVHGSCSFDIRFPAVDRHPINSSI